jgi:hypothetical protein
MVGAEAFEALSKPKFIGCFYEIATTLELISVWDYTLLNKFSSLIQERLARDLKRASTAGV